MTTTSDIRASIVAKLIAIPGIGQVHNYERYASQQSKLKELFSANDRILGWVVRRGGFKKTMIADALFTVRTNWQIRGYMSLDDAAETELLFNALADLVQATLANDPTFGIASWVPDYEFKADEEPVMFCGVLCHNVNISFDTVHEETATIDGMIDGVLDEFLRLSAQYDIEPHASAAEHTKWSQEPPDHSTSKPDLTDNITLQE
jgi:hypothetical protein